MNCSPSNLIALSSCFCGTSRKTLRQISAYLTCAWANDGSSPVIPPAVTPPVLTFDIPNSISGQATILNWTEGNPSIQTSIWKSTGGAAYVLYATVTGSTYTDSTLPIAFSRKQDVYKVQPAGSVFSNEAGVSQDLTLDALSTDSFSNLVFEYNSFLSVGIVPVVSLDFSELLYAGDFNLSHCRFLTHINFNPQFRINTNGLGVNCHNCLLDAATVNTILAWCRATPTAAGTIITLDSGNAAPTGQGIADKAWLIANGCTVTTN